ncbi:hypothetical protein FLAG1_09550 [Fusarium langsethiae]|uniref:Uncharacterized protein n=1 Tax=Fusarium langsethiae TaxID=179993 RepID=A0A0M9EQ63_FUSLA|nr:hypothetical protein FLAG1_09550 [Fusarium langsethiae]GKU06042.1 unnamed protein product [Fusarium langsethiae]GKU22325.1 unnamed protein product [Fusarium langsethiae]
MKFSAVLSSILAAGTAIAASIPHATGALDLPQNKRELVDSSSVLVVRANDGTDANNSEDLANALGALDGFFNELIHVTTDDGKTAGQLNKRDAVGDLLQNMIDLIDSGTLNVNELVKYGFGVFTKFVASVDLNALVGEGIDRLAKLITSIPGIPGGVLIQPIFTAVKAFVSNVNFNALAQTWSGVIGNLVTSFDWNSAIIGGLRFIKGLLSAVPSA